jgi:hypothetical protein
MKPRDFSFWMTTLLLLGASFAPRAQAQLCLPLMPCPDTTPPSVSITAPASGASVAGSVAVKASAADNRGVAGVQFRLDGADLGAEDTAAPYELAWDTAGVPNGSHTRYQLCLPRTWVLKNTIPLQHWWYPVRKYKRPNIPS